VNALLLLGGDTFCDGDANAVLLHQSLALLNVKCRELDR
jgi:hypothetical protein